MNRNVNKIITEGLRHEGGFVNHPNDPGGATNKGITIVTFRRYIKPNGTIADLKELTTDQAIVVYKRQYWDTVVGDLLPTGVDLAVYDFGINSGPSRAIKTLQKIVGTTVDGRIGPATISATKLITPAAVVNRLCDERLVFMKRIKNRKTGTLLWDTFGKGWGRRVASVRQVALDMIRDDNIALAIPANAGPGKPTKGFSLLSFFSAILALFTNKKG